MKKVKELIYFPVLVFPIIQLFVSNEMFWILGFILLLYIVFQDRFIITIPFSEYKMLLLFFAWGLLIGVSAFIAEQLSVRDLVRDIFYYSNPIVFMYIGYSYAKKEVKLYRLLNSFIISGAVVSMVGLVKTISSYSIMYALSSVHEWRSSTGGGAIIIGVSLAIALSGIIEKDKRLPLFLQVICIGISGVYFLFSLSRTNLLILLIMYFVLVLRKDNAQNIILRTAGLLVLIAVALIIIRTYIPSALVEQYVDKVFSSFTEISTNNIWSSSTVIQGNWRGYETYCATQQWESSNLFTQIFGAGFGKRIYVGNYAYTLLNQYNSDGSAANSIAVLHNGYATQLIKLGVLGVILYVIFYLRLIVSGRRAIKVNQIYGRLLSALATTFLIQTYFLNGIYKDYCFYPMVILIGYSAFNCERVNVLRHLR